MHDNNINKSNYIIYKQYYSRLKKINCIFIWKYCKFVKYIFLYAYPSSMWGSVRLLMIFLPLPKRLKQFIDGSMKNLDHHSIAKMCQTLNNSLWLLCCLRLWFFQNIIILNAWWPWKDIIRKLATKGTKIRYKSTCTL